MLADRSHKKIYMGTHYYTAWSALSFRLSLVTGPSLATLAVWGTYPHTATFSHRLNGGNTLAPWLQVNVCDAIYIRVYFRHFQASTYNQRILHRFRAPLGMWVQAGMAYIIACDLRPVLVAVTISSRIFTTHIHARFPITMPREIRYL